MVIKWGLLEIGFAFSFAFCWVADKAFRATISKALVAVAGIHIPVVGHPFAFLGTVDTNVKNWLGRGMQSSEKGLSYAFNQLIGTFALLIGVPLAIALALKELADWVLHNASKTIVKPITHTVKVIERQTKVVTKTVTQVAVPHIEHEIAALRAQIAHMSHAVAGTLAHPIPGLGKLERDVANEAKRLKKLEKAGVGVGAAALVTAVLARLGLSSLRCSRTQKWNKGLCGTPEGWLEDILAGGVLLFGVLSVVEFVKAAQTFEDDAAEALRLAIKEFPGH